MDSYVNGRAPKGPKNAKTNQQIAAKEGAKNIYHRDTEVDWLKLGKTRDSLSGDGSFLFG